MREAIDQYFAESVIEGTVCDQCHNPRSHFEKLVHLPDFLLVKVNRIEHVNRANGPQIKKLTRDIALENRLTFSADRFDPRSSQERSDPEYELTAMVMHAGTTITSGHFYAFVKARGSKWVMASDETLQPFSRAGTKSPRAFRPSEVPTSLPTAGYPASRFTWRNLSLRCL